MSQVLFGLIFFICTWSSSQSSALTLKISSKLTDSEQSRALAAVETVLKKLPAKIKDSLNFELKIIFKTVPISASNLHMGHAGLLFNEIEINKSLLSFSASDQQNFQLLPDSLERTLAHEIAHFYDFKNYRTPDMQHFINTCDDREESCQAKKYQYLTISADPEFMAMNHWQRGLVAKNINNNPIRLANSYSVSALRENFPTLFEYYLFDKDFACRQPLVARFFNKKFEIKNQTSPCPEKLYWYKLESQGPKFIEVDKSKIWAIDYFWAAEGAGAGSSHGHAMLRLVICNPSRQEPSSDCYKDISYHLILSFGANTPDLNFNNIGGLIGRYPMTLSVVDIYTARAIYNLTELRDLYAIPLKLNSEQKSNLIDYLYDYMWSFRGDYYFIDRNCSSETSRALVAAGVDFNSAAKIQSHMPDVLFTNLLNSELNNSGAKTRAELKKNPLLYMHSSQAIIDIALRIISDNTKVEYKNIESYFEKVSSDQVPKILEKSPENSKLTYALYYLEGIRLNRLKQILYKDLFRKEKALKEEALKDLSTQSKKYFDYSFAGSFLNSKNYGNPTDKEIEIIKSEINQEIQIFQQEQSGSMMQLSTEIQVQARSMDDTSIKSSQKTLDFLKKKIKY